MWRFLSAKQSYQSYMRTKKFCTAQNIAFYSGKIKSRFFYKLLDLWQPDIILVAFFGQIISRRIIKYPSLGIYNLHPSDITKNITGPQPYEGEIKHNFHYSKVTLHRVSQKVDRGKIIALTPPIPMFDITGKINKNHMMIDEMYATFIYPIIIFTLLKKIINTHRKCSTLNLIFPDKLFEKIRSYRYPKHIEIVPFKKLLNKMNEVLHLEADKKERHHQVNQHSHRLNTIIPALLLLSNGLKKHDVQLVLLKSLLSQQDYVSQ